MTWLLLAAVILFVLIQGYRAHRRTRKALRECDDWLAAEGRSPWWC